MIPSGRIRSGQAFFILLFTPKANFESLSIFADQGENPNLPVSNCDLTFLNKIASPIERNDIQLLVGADGKND